MFHITSHIISTACHIISYYNMPYHALPYNAKLYHTMQYHYYAIPCHAMPYHAIPYNTLQYNTIPCRTIIHLLVPYSKPRANTIIWSICPPRRSKHLTMIVGWGDFKITFPWILICCLQTLLLIL